MSLKSNLYVFLYPAFEARFSSYCKKKHIGVKSFQLISERDFKHCSGFEAVVCRLPKSCSILWSIRGRAGSSDRIDCLFFLLVCDLFFFFPDSLMVLKVAKNALNIS